jgi:2-pyrone-4,6-dicarboxylate lactonase
MRPCPPPNPSPSKPQHRLPPGACDAHCHVFGPAAAFPYSDSRAYTPTDMPKETLFALHEHLGVERRAIVQASCHGTDNRALIDALRARPETSRGVAALADDISDEDLTEMHDAGIRGARFNFMARIQKAPEPNEIDALIRRFAPLGWHVVLHFDSDQLPGLRPWIESLEVPVLIDHAARLNAGDCPGPYFDSFCELMARPNIWTKLSGTERGSATGAPYDDMLPILTAVAEIAPDRVIWGTDWPHPVLGKPMPDDGALVDYVWQVLPDADRRHAALVDNPARLYGF